MLSVDPAELDPAVLALPNVVHVQQMIQAARSVLLTLLAESQQTDGGENGGECLATVDDKILGTNVDTTGDSEEAEVSKQPTGAAEVLSVGQKEGINEGMSCSGDTAIITPCASATPAFSAKATSTDTGADLVVSDMNAEPQVVTDVLLSSMAAGLAKPGALVIATFKDFCGRKRRMRDEVTTALERLDAGTGADNGWAHSKGSIEMGGDGGDSDACVQGEKEQLGWRIEGIETINLLAGGRAEVTIVGRVALGTIGATKMPTVVS